MWRILRPLSLAGLILAVASCAPAPRPAAMRPIASPTDLPGLSNFAAISDSLYRGAQPSGEGFEQLKRMGVKTIVDLRGEIHRDRAEVFGFKTVHIPSSAARPEEQKIVQFLRVVTDPSNQPVFVHCWRGADRTGYYVAAYRMAEQGWSAADAEREMNRFGFASFWKAVPVFLNHLDVEKLRREVAGPATRKGPTTRKSAVTLKSPTTRPATRPAGVN